DAMPFAPPCLLLPSPARWPLPPSGSSWMTRVFTACQRLVPRARPERGQTGVWGIGFLAYSASGAEEHEHREDAPRLASGGRQAELPEDGRDVLLDRTEADHQLVRDALVGAA